MAETGRAVIMYDQLGCGKSFVESHPELWTPETWLNELCAPLVAKTLYDGIPDSKWHLFVGARHMPFAEQNDEYCQVLEEWLAEKD